MTPFALKKRIINQCCRFEVLILRIKYLDNYKEKNRNAFAFWVKRGIPQFYVVLWKL